MFGRKFDPKQDRVVWTWSWEHYGFFTPESRATGHAKALGQFPFDTRKQKTEEFYCGFDPSSWQNIKPFSQMKPWELMRAYRRIFKMRDRRTKKLVEDFVRQNRWTRG